MKAGWNILMAGCALFLLCQCATQDDIRKLNYQIRAVNQKVDDVKTTTVDQIQKRQASSVSKIDQVDEELVRIRSLIEENEHQAQLYRKEAQESLTTLQQALEKRMQTGEQKVAELEQRIEQLTAALEALQQARIREAEQRAREAARKAELARKRTVMAATAGSGFVRVTPSGKKVRVSRETVATAEPAVIPPEPVEQKEKKTVSAKKAEPKKKIQVVTTEDHTASAFEQAMDRFRKKQYKKAYQAFEEVLAGNPQGEKAAKTLYYMGECLFKQGEYDLAILDYQKVISNHARDPLAPAALLKQGMSFEKLTDNETAKIIYNKLVNEYGQTPEADKARERLKKF